MKPRLKISQILSDSGVTIIELIIATTVFSVALLIFSGTFVRISQLFYKGTVSASTQEAVRQLSHDLASAIQFSSGTVTGRVTDTGGISYVCVGNTRYAFKMNQKATATNNVLERQTFADSCVPPGGVTLSRNYLPNNMRLLEFKVTQDSSRAQLYSIDLTIAYGDDDLLTTHPGTPTPNSKCKSAPGSQFCAVSSVQKTIVRRIN